MQALFELHAKGALRPRITARHGLDEVAEALRAMQARQVMGKVIVEPSR